MLRDAEYFRTRVIKLEGAGDVGEYVFNAVQGKNVAEKPRNEDSKADKHDEIKPPNSVEQSK